MAGINEEEDYLHQLLENAMMQDAKFEEEDNRIDGFSEDEETAEDPIMPDETTDEEAEIFDIFSDAEPAEEIEEAAASEESPMDTLALEEDFAGNDAEEEPFFDAFALEDAPFDENAVEEMPTEEADPPLEDEEIFSLDELIRNVQEEETVTDEQAADPEEPSLWEDDGLEPDFLDELKGIIEEEPGSSPTEEPDGFEQQEERLDEELFAGADETEALEPEDGYEETSEDGGLDDIFALDDGLSFSEALEENQDEPPTGGEPDGISLSGDEEYADGSENGAEAAGGAGGDFEDAEPAEADGEPKKQTAKSKKAKKAKEKKKGGKEKKSKDKGQKKFSLKNFFIDDEEEDPENQTADSNQQLIDELYEGKSSLHDADPNDIDASVKKKKEKKVKEKKEKPKKEPKPKKAKEPKEKAPGGGFNTGLLFKAVFIAAIIVAAVIFGSKFLGYRNSVKSAERYFTEGNYKAAYNKLNGLNMKNKDNDFYMKTRTVMLVYQGLESYENYIALDDVPHALDALVSAVGRKNKTEDQAIRYEVTNEVNTVYNRIIGMLERYGISEAQALDYFTMTDYDEYFAILEDIGGRGVGSNN